MRYRYSSGENGAPVKKALVYTRDEHGISFDDVDIEALGIVRRLKDAGYDTYIVGGAVRDLILGKKPKDFDIASEASPARIKKIFRNSRIIGRRFRLVHVYFGPRIFEVSTFRSLKDGPTSNTFGTIEEDVLRRDFTMNALFYDPGQQIVVDYVGGMKDIRRKLVRPIIPLQTIFKDDPVRMIRAVKYAAVTGFSLPLPLKWKIKKQSPLLAGVSPSRRTEEIFKIIHSSCVARVVEALDSIGLYQYLQPCAARLMREQTGFRERYLRSMTALNQEGFKGLPGEILGALVNDYLEDVTDWERGIAENYKTTFTAARSFVLPMNPPGFELDHAVRRFFAAHGITIKKSRFMERPSPARESAEGRIDSAEPHKRRRRRRRKNPANTEGEHNILPDNAPRFFRDEPPRSRAPGY
ncbi:MAG: polynucleotide adenylyltransferase PcnB [Treponema sp.]|jgi:poly(A) polymerase|nr:polynucleotide adenylyltransferase PcnB [Treponema sp.]